MNKSPSLSPSISPLPSERADEWRFDDHDKTLFADLHASVQVLVDGQRRMERLLARMATKGPNVSGVLFSSEPVEYSDRGNLRRRTLPSASDKLQVRQSSRDRGRPLSLDLDQACASQSSRAVDLQADPAAAPWRSHSSSRRISDGSLNHVTFCHSATLGGSGNSSAYGTQVFEVRQELQGSWEQLDEICSEFLHTMVRGNRPDQDGNGFPGSLELRTTRSSSCRTVARRRCCKGLACVLSPSSTLRLLVDLTSIVVLLYDLLTLPYFVAFNVAQEGIFLHLSVVSLTFWVVDIFANFRTGFYYHGELKMQPAAICRHYLSTSFPLDFGLVAIDCVALAMSMALSSKTNAPDAFKIGRMIKITRLVRCFALLRLRRVSDVVDRVSRGDMALHATASVLVDIAKFTSVILWLNHILACLWVFIGRSGTFDTGASWLDLNTGFGGSGSTYRDSRDLYQYSTAMHWALTQMTPGSMQAFPMNSVERVFNLVCLIFGMMGFSTLISSLSASVTQFKLNMNSRYAKLQALHRFLRTVSISSQLAMQVRKQITERLRDARPLVVSDVKVLELLSNSLRSTLQTEICRPHLQHHRFFNLLLQSQQPAAKELCMTCTKFSSLLRLEDLFLFHTEAEGIHFLTKGTMTYVLKECKPIESTLSVDLAPPSDDSKKNVEAGRWLSEAALWMAWQHVGTAENTSQAPCEVLTVPAKELAKLFKKRGGLLEQLAWAYAQNFCALMKAAASGESRPTDLNVAFEVEQTFVAMPKAVKMLIGYQTIAALNETYEISWLDTFELFHHQLSIDVIGQLETEVANGSSILITEGNRNEVLRMVTEVTLKLTRADGRLLVLLPAQSTRANTAPKTTCRLPTLECVGNESTDETLERLLCGQLSELKEGIDNVKIDMELASQGPGRLGICTWCRRTTVSAQWTDLEGEQADPEFIEGSPSLENINEEAKEAKGKLVHSKTVGMLAGFKHNADKKNEPSSTPSPTIGQKSYSDPNIRSTASNGKSPLSTRTFTQGQFPAGQVFHLPDGTLAAWMTKEDFRAHSASGGSSERALIRWLQNAGTPVTSPKGRRAALPFQERRSI